MPNTPKPNPDVWVDQYGDYLFRYAQSRVNDTATAEDLVQETFLAALRTYANFDGKSSERTWFVSILKHKIIDFYRKQGRRSKYFESPGVDDSSEDFQENGFWKLDNAPGDWGEHPEEELHQKEFIEILRACLKALPKKIAAVFTLREMEGMDSKSICKELEITSSNLWVMLHRARHQLRKCLDVNWFGSLGEDT